MNKLIVISGITSSGKTVQAQLLAKHLNTSIIIGDSLQMYKNWRVSSGWPNNTDQYKLIGQVDATNTKITSSLYKQWVKEQLINNPHPIIEGGCSFYLNYLLNSGEEQFTNEQINEAETQAKLILSTKHDWHDTIRQYCPTYNSSIPVNDTYRMVKALRYAILTNGQHYTNPNNTSTLLQDSYDVRGFFLYANPEGIICIVTIWCEQMVVDGLIDEFYSFYLQTKDSPNLHLKTTPIGYNEFVKLITEWKETKAKYISQDRFDQIQKNRVIEFVQHFFVSTRQYSSQQRKYFKNHLVNFLWINVEQQSVQDTIQNAVNMSRDEFIALSGKEHQRHAQQPNAKKRGKQRDPMPDPLVVRQIQNTINQLIK